MRLRPLFVTSLLLLACGFAAAETAGSWVEELEQYRAERNERLRSPSGWLTLAGLHWLEPGENVMGSDEDSPVVLAAPGVPARAGVLVLENETVTLRAAPEAQITLEGEPVTERVLSPDVSGTPDLLSIGRLTFHVIRRGDRFGVRVKDTEHPRLLAFEGLDFYPPDPTYRLDAVFKPFDEPREIEVATVVGSSAKLLATGAVEFELRGRRHTLLPLVSEPDETELWFIFKDRTSGKETYGFRYLYGDLDPEAGRVDLDFNRTYNPPCAFTPYATCPLPPRENRLETRIEAGERIFK